MSLSPSVVDSLPYVNAGLNYLAPMTEKPRTYSFDPPDGNPKTNVRDDLHVCAIHDARPVSKDISLGEYGFELIAEPTTLDDFTDEDAIRSVYYKESEDILKRITGAYRVVIFDHTVRRRQAGVNDRTQGAPRQPASRVHVDQTVKSGPQRVRHELPEEADELLKGRVQIINLWRPICVPAWDSPLAVCDPHSVTDDDLVASDLVFPNRIGETYALTFSPRHRWLYYPGMRTDEALLLKCYDSATDGTVRFVPHGAFADPSTPPDAPPRESIELRVMVFSH